MALNYAKLFNRRMTPQSRPIPGSTQVVNSGGGYSWQVDDWAVNRVLPESPCRPACGWIR